MAERGHPQFRPSRGGGGGAARGGSAAVQVDRGAVWGALL